MKTAVRYARTLANNGLERCVVDSHHQKSTSRKTHQQELTRRTDEIRGFICAAVACVLCDLRIRTQGPRHFCLLPSSARIARCNDLSGHRSGFFPAFKRAEEVGLIRSHTAAAMTNTGQQEKAHPVILLATDPLGNGFVVS